ncbi:MAG: hypothetical protein ACRD29_19900 [Acidimicrobiales bacterium]
MRYLHLFTDDNGEARLEDVDITLNVVESTLEFSERLPVSTIFFARGAAGRDRAQAPEPRRNWVICLTGSCDITASGETRTLRPGDVMLADDIDGRGHTSFTGEGYTAAVIPLDPAST